MTVGRNTMRIWDGAGLRRFLTAHKGHRLYAMWSVAVSTGLRHSELLGRPVPDVDVKAATVTVQREGQRRTRGG